LIGNANRKVALRKASLIEDDIFKEKFDPTLEKYKSPTGKITPIEESNKISLLDLWSKYTEFQKDHLE